MKLHFLSFGMLELPFTLGVFMRKYLVRFFIIAFALFLIPTLALSYGDDGHRLINQAAVARIPADMPEFMKAGSVQIVYEAPEPDRWRSDLEKPLEQAQAPDHFIDMEYVDWMKQLPADRYKFIQAIYEYRAAHPEAGIPQPEKVGFQPYITIEVFDRLKVAFREYRHAKAKNLPTAQAEANVLFYAGWLGHYVGDGANPMHTSIQYNGWVGPNPNGYSTSHDIHYNFESGFVRSNLNEVQIDGMVGAPKHLENPFEDYIAYLRTSRSHIEKLYAIDKECGFEGRGSADAVKFEKERLAAGAQMLVNLWYTAWVDSAKEPEPYHSTREPKERQCPPAPKAAAPATMEKHL
jgi:hypothetical protein